MATRRKVTPKTELARVLREMLNPLVRPLQRLRKNPRSAMASPQTTLDRIKRDIETSVRQDVDRRLFTVPFLRMLELLPPIEEMRQGLRAVIDRDRAELRSDPVGAELLRLYDAADAAGPVSPMRFVCGSTDEEAVDIFAVIGKFTEADRSRGEKRVRLLLEAMPDLLEKVYSRYLRVVWILSCLAAGNWPSQPSMGIGALVKELAPRVRTYAGLVDVDAALLRNAVAHRHVEYFPAKRAVEFRAPPQGWKLTLTRTQLESRLISMWRPATALKSKLQSISTAEFYLRSGMLEQVPRMRDAMQGDVHAVEALDEKPDRTAILAELFRRKPPPGTDLWFLPRNHS